MAIVLLDDVRLLLQRCETTNPVSDDGTHSSNSEERLSRDLEATKRALLLQCEATRDPRWLVALCHVVNHFAARFVIAASTAAPSEHRHVRMNKCVFLLENTVMTALHSLQRTTTRNNNNDDDGSAMEVDAGTGSEQFPRQHRGFKSQLTKSYQRLFESILSSFSDEESGNRSRIAAAAILSQLGLLLSICWLTADRNTLLSSTTELLVVAAQCCGRYEDTQSSVKGPLFLLGLLHLVEKRDDEQALLYFRTVAMLENASPLTAHDGAFHYWFGVALFKNGHAREATDQLQQCLQCNYSPIASLNLSALAHLRGNTGGLHASSLELQRALEIDFLESVTLFNYAALLGTMRNFAAQQQMLDYYEEAIHSEGSVETERKRARSGTPRAKRDDTVRSRGAPGLFTEAQLTVLFAPNAVLVTPAMLSTQLAYTAMENGDWEQSKLSFEELLAPKSSESAEAQVEVYRDYIYVLLQSNLHSLALETCDRVLQFTRDDVSSDRVGEVSLLLIHLYRADALLSLERVLECHQYLRETVEPRIQQLLPSQQPQHQQSGSSKPKLISEDPNDEATACHIQLLNNLAVVTACQNDDDTGVHTAITILRHGIHMYPQALSIKFNLVLLLWRKQQREAACSIWFEARGWSLHMDARDVGDDRKAIEMVMNAEEAAILAAASPHPQVSEHVRSSDANDEDGCVARQQLLYLDALVLNHWGKIQSSRAIETSVNYVQYLDSLSTNSRHT